MKYYLSIIIFLFAGAVAFSQQISSIKVSQDGDNVIITYNLTGGDEGQTFDIDVKCSEDDGRNYLITPRSLSGDLKGVTSGYNKQIVWKVLNDCEELVGDNMVFKIIATAKTGFGNIEMVFVKGGTFSMGSSDEKPVHSVSLSDFYIGKYEVTQAQWEEIMGKNPSRFKGSNNPVEKISWNEVQEFIRKLNKKTGKNYRLPTEAEWEYAARGGKNSRGYKYSGSSNIGAVAWYTGNSNGKTHSVGQKQANELGLYDMSGNVWEWCDDWYGSDYYKSSPSNNPKGPSSGSRCVLRGGSWYFNASSCWVANRSNVNPGYSLNYIGFRLASSSGY